MRMSELAARSGLPVATVKYYLREGLLPAGRRTAATQAQYDERHVHRLRLVRALTQVAGLRLEAVRDVLAAVEDPTRSWHEAVGAAHTRLTPPPEPPAGAPALARVEALVRRRGWTLSDAGPHRAALAAALEALEEVGLTPREEVLDAYAEAAERVAAVDVAAVAETDREAALEHVVVGTVLMEPVLLLLRRMAQEAVSYRTRR